MAKEGVLREDDLWVAYIDGKLVASGPDKVVIEAFYNARVSEDEHRWTPEDE